MISLGAVPRLTPARQTQLSNFIDSTRDNPPSNLVDCIRESLHVDLSTRYAGLSIPHPFGKASGQLSCTASQVEEDAESGLAFVVLKTVIAESPDGSRTMASWSNPETRMKVERRISRSGREGWTVTWKGRGWSGSLGEYVQFLKDALAIGGRANLLVVPSVKYHLPRRGEVHDAAEYKHTTSLLAEAWSANRPDRLVVEKDLSPTLAGDSLANDRLLILEWLSGLTAWIERAVPGTRVGIKVMNAMFEDDFQVEMVRAVEQGAKRPDFLVLFNRLFDPAQGVAYGGWDLSERNLSVLDCIADSGLPSVPLSATGNICSGRVMLEYALRGCENGQLHTFFQVPRSEYLISGVSRSRCALYTLLLHPDLGLVPWLWTLNEVGLLEEKEGVLHFADAVACGIR